MTTPPPPGVPFDEGLAHLAAYRRGTRAVSVPVGHVDDSGFPLWQWVAEQRVAMRRGDLTDAQAQALRRLDVTPAGAFAERAASYLDALDAYIAVHGSADVPILYDADGRPLGRWLYDRRREMATGRIASDTRVMLQQRGIEPLTRTYGTGTRRRPAR